LTIGSLLLSMSFVLFSLLLSLWLRLGTAKDLLVATVRATVQLLAVGYILTEIFSLRSGPYMILMLLAMVSIAAANSARRLNRTKGVFWRVFAAIAVSEIFSIGWMVLLKIVPFIPQYVIPLSGMVIGNAMIGASLLLNRLREDIRARKDEVLVFLSLGATPLQSIDAILKSAIRAAMIPTVDSMKTVGLVQLPGMMTGQILAGANPGTAVRYQLMILFTLTASMAICAVVLAYLSYRLFFTKANQILLEHPRRN
jgi:putative ABC transport system permease protein